jgi:YidC/Oxa1 family membrane protein insertase
MQDAKAGKDGTVSAAGPWEFAGIQDVYFAAVFLPKPPGAPVDIRTFSDTVPVASGAQQQEMHVGASVGGAAVNDFALFVGPKDIDLLRSVDPKLSQIVQWGWFGFIAKPLFLALNWVNDHWVQNYGWSIVLVTIAINILLLPLKLSSLKSAKKMSGLQPRIQAINEKYKNVGLKDPKKQQQNEELMALYKEAGVNPLGGCVPLIIQLPFLYAFYTVLTVSTEMRGARWLWVTDLSQPEQLAIHILPLLLIATQFVLQKMTPAAPGQDPTQQKMMLFMPLLFGFMFYSMSSGLVLYWLTGNVVGILQQWVINRLTPAPAVAPPAAPPVSGKRTRK